MTERESHTGLNVPNTRTPSTNFGFPKPWIFPTWESESVRFERRLQEQRWEGRGQCRNSWVPGWPIASLVTCLSLTHEVRPFGHGLYRRFGHGLNCLQSSCFTAVSSQSPLRYIAPGLKFSEPQAIFYLTLAPWQSTSNSPWANQTSGCGSSIILFPTTISEFESASSCLFETSPRNDQISYCCANVPIPELATQTLAMVSSFMAQIWNIFSLKNTQLMYDTSLRWWTCIWKLFRYSLLTHQDIVTPLQQWYGSLLLPT